MERLGGEGENMELTGQDSSVVLGREQDHGTWVEEGMGSGEHPGAAGRKAVTGDGRRTGDFLKQHP